jgi:serine protease Do
VKGAIVTNVEEDSNSAEAGLRPGDVIVELDKQPVHSAEDAVSLSDKAKGDQILLRVWSRGAGGAGGTRFVVVDNTKKK